MKIEYAKDVSQIINVTSLRLENHLVNSPGLMVDSQENQSFFHYFEILDKLDLSQEGIIKSRLFKVEEGGTSNLEGVKDRKPMSQAEMFEQAALGSALIYRQKVGWIQDNVQDKDDKNIMLDTLNKEYIKSAGATVQQIGLKLDEFFNSGPKALQAFSDQEVSDLFDIETFKSQLAEKILTAKDFVMTSDQEVTMADIRDYIRQNEQVSNRVETMTYDDLEKVIGFMDRYGDLVSGVDFETKSGGKYYANIDDAVNRAIENLNVSESVENALLENQKMKTEGMIRQEAFSITIANYDATLEAYEERLNRLLSRLAMIQNHLDAVEENSGLDPTNERLLGLLEFQKKVSEDILALKEESKAIEKEKTDFEDHPEKVVETDTYKGIKTEYESEKKRLDDEA